MDSNFRRLFTTGTAVFIVVLLLVGNLQCVQPFANVIVGRGSHKYHHPSAGAACEIRFCSTPPKGALLLFLQEKKDSYGFEETTTSTVSNTREELVATETAANERLVNAEQIAENLLSLKKEAPPTDNGNNAVSSSSLQLEQSSEIAVAGLAVLALSSILGDLLSNYEWVQTLRYFWPLSIGVYYGMLWNHYEGNSQERGEGSNTNRSTSWELPIPNRINRSPLVQLGYIFGGLGLFVGGLADALLPVYVTGPNWLTNAGLAPDCAILLLALSAAENFGWMDAASNSDLQQDDSNSQMSDNNPHANTLESKMPLLLKVTLWAELYKLGEGSIDEVVSNVQTALSSVQF